MKHLILIAMMCCAPLAAQQAAATTKQAPEIPNQQKLFILKYADPQRLATLFSVFNTNGANIRANAEMHALAVTAPDAVMQAIEESIGKLDVPSATPKDLDFTVYLVVGTEDQNIGTAVLPKDLDSVVTQLRGAFAFKNYRLLDELTIRSRTGQVVTTQSSGGSVEITNQSHVVNTNFSIDSATLSPDGTSIRLENMRCRTNVPYEETPGHIAHEDLNLRTDLDIKEGQKVVVGRIGMTNQRAMFVVITVKIVQ